MNGLNMGVGLLEGLTPPHLNIIVAMCLTTNA